MKKLIRALVALAVLAFGVVIAPPAQAADPPSSYTPKTGALFNDPNGTRDEQLALMDPIVDSVNSVPAGSIIRFVAYSFSWQPLADALISAHKRGVQVRLLIDSHHYQLATPGTDTPQLQALRRALGTDRSKPSYIRTCKYGCMSNSTSYIHSKLYLFSRVGDAKYVSMISSANPAETGISKSWNNTYTIANNKTVYDANVDNFNDMLPDKTNTDYYHTVSSSPCQPSGTSAATCKLYYFPRAGSTPSSDTIYNVLSDVTCTGAAGGYGVNGKTQIKIAAYTWTSRRLHIAQKLTELKGKGCNIEVIYPADNVDATVATELRKKSIPVYNGRIDRDGDGVNELYPHSKYLLINGVYQGDSSFKGVYTASQNFTNNSLRESNEVLLRIPIDSVLDQYVANFNSMKNYIQEARSAAKTTAGVDSARERAIRDNAPDPDE
jgi:phosphatidylserine/phosphatidylglycerophosphate/cardiolipin synthase-like enzyme